MTYLGGNRLKDTVDLVSEQSKRLFLPAEWKRVLRIAGWKAGMYFVDNWLPRRWDEGYARRAGYSGKGGRDTIPYYEKGEWIRNAMRAAPRVTVSGSSMRLRIPVPIGHPITPKTSKDFLRVTDQERTMVAQTFADAVADLIKGSASVKRTVGRTTIMGRNGKMRRVAIKGWTRRLSDQDRALSKTITQRGGFRGGSVATELQANAFTLRENRKLLVKKTLTKTQLKRRHQEWARTAGGAAGPTGQQILSGQTTSKTYAGSRKQRHAEAQRRYRDKYRRGRRALDSGTAGANAFISSTI